MSTRSKTINRPWLRVLCLCMALCMLVGMLPATAIAASTPKYLYMKPNSNWKVDNARFAAYFFGNGEKWVSGEKVDTDLYKFEVPAGFPNVIFCRMNPSQTANNWNNKWNQTDDLTVPTNGNNCYSIKSGTWDKGGGTWSTIATCKYEGHSGSLSYVPGSNGTHTQKYSCCGETYGTAESCTNNAEYPCYDGNCVYCGGFVSKVPHISDAEYSCQAGFCKVCGEEMSQPSHTSSSQYPCQDAVCTICGIDMPKVDHQWKDATCTYAKTCSVCGETEGEALGHDWVDGTCSQPKTCSVCGETEGDILPHNFIDEKCEYCQLSQYVTIYFQNNWNWSDVCLYYWYNDGTYDVAWPGTAMEEYGNDGTYDVYEGKIPYNTYGMIINGIKDDGSNNRDQTPNIESGWYDGICYYMAWDDGNQVRFEDINVILPPCSHSWKDATCTAPKTCELCGETEGEALGHNWADATCTEPKTCPVCGETEGEALGHKWDNATCTGPKTCSVCGVTDGEALGHDWDDATCTAPKTCSVCGVTEGEALGHDWDDATCTAPKTCSVCGVTDGEALGHDWDDATCTAPKTCSVCGVTEGEALDHSYGDDGICDLCGEGKLFDLWVQGIQVTGTNAIDILGDLDEGATVTYDATTNTLTLNNAAITGVLHSITASNGITLNDTNGGIIGVGELNLNIVGRNTVSSTGVVNSYGIHIMGDLNVSGSGSLDIRTGAASFASYGMKVYDLTLSNGVALTVSAGKANISVGVNCQNLTVNSGASLTATGDPEGQFFGSGILSAGIVKVQGTVNALATVQDPSDMQERLYVYGNAVLAENNPTGFAGYVITEGALLTVAEGVTLDMSSVTADQIVLDGAIVNNGTVILPDTFTYVTIPTAITGGTVTIGESSYIWNGSKYICIEGCHSWTDATCTEPKICGTCGERDGEPLGHSYGDDGICDLCGEGKLFDLWVQGVQVTGTNAIDILGDLDEGATVTYDATTNTLTLNNASLTGALMSGATEEGTFRAILTQNSGLNLNLVGENTITVSEPDAFYIYVIEVDGDLTIDGDGSLCVTTAGAVSWNVGITCDDLLVNGGNVEVHAGVANVSAGVLLDGGATVESGAVLTASGNPDGMYFGIGIEGYAPIINNGTINAITSEVWAHIGATRVVFYGQATLAENLMGSAISYVFAEGSVLTVAEGVTLTMFYVTPEYFVFDGTVVNNGTVILPDFYTYATIPADLTGGTVTIGKSSYIWNGSKYICVEGCHSWTDATCTEPKTCSVCGETEGEVLDHADNDKNGRCDTCSCLMQPAKLAMTSISLKGNIALNYYMLLSDEVLADETAYMQFTMADGKIIAIPVSEGVPMVRDGETYYVYSCAVDAKEMTDDVISQFFYEGGSTNEHTYSVQAYANYILTYSKDNNVKTLVEAMLNYGAASQIHFGYRTDDLANAGLEAPDYANVTIAGFNAVAGQGTDLAKLYSASLILKSETTLRFFFRMDSSATLTATYNGQALEVNERSGLYYVDVVGIAAKDLDKNVIITISDGINTAEVLFNPMSYCQGVLNDTTGAFGAEMKDLVCALYLYNQAANVYFKEN